MKTFHVQRGIVIKQSKVFAAAFRVDETTGSGFKEATESSMRLPAETPRTFKLFVHWLYTGKYPSTEKVSASWDESTKTITSLINLYVFGDKYDVPNLRLNVFNALLESTRCRKILGFALAIYVYELTTSTSPLRKLFSIRIAHELDNDWESELGACEKSALREHPDMMFDLLMLMSERSIGDSDEYVMTRLKALLPEVAPERMEDKAQS